MKFTLSGLYIITDKKLIDRAKFVKTVEEAVMGGASILQLREKGTGRAKIIELGSELLKITKKHNIPLILNDYPELVREIGADGVHLGENDPDIKSVRQLLGTEKIIGVSCYNSIKRAEYAVENGADYIVFGTPYDTPTKPGREPTPLEVIREGVKKFTDTPIFAIGGIDENTAPEILGTGVDGIAAITAIFGSDDPGRVARNLSSLMVKH